MKLSMRFTVLFLASVLLGLMVWTPVKAGEMGAFEENGDKVSLMGDIKVDRACVGDIIAVFGNIDIEENVSGDVVSIFGNVTVNAKVDGEVITVLGKIKLGERAEITKDIITIGNLEKVSGSRVYGQDIRVNAGMLTALRAILSFVFSFFVLILGLVTITLFKDRFQNISYYIEKRVVKKTVLGLLGFVGLSILLILLFITVLYPILFAILLVVAETTACVYFGKVVLKAIHASSNVYLQFVTGLLILTLVKAITTCLIPEIGFAYSIVIDGFINIYVYSLGIGILIDSKAGMNLT